MFYGEGGRLALAGRQVEESARLAANSSSGIRGGGETMGVDRYPWYFTNELKARVQHSITLEQLRLGARRREIGPQRDPPSQQWLGAS